MPPFNFVEQLNRVIKYTESYHSAKFENVEVLKNLVLKFFRVLAHYIREGGVRLGKGHG